MFKMSIYLTMIAMLSATPAIAQAPTGPDKISIEFDAARLALIVKAIGNGLVKNEADPLLQSIQTQINAQMAQWQKDHQPAEPVPTPTPAPSKK